jgi:hypothetical protein
MSLIRKVNILRRMRSVADNWHDPVLGTHQQNPCSAFAEAGVFFFNNNSKQPYIGFVKQKNPIDNQGVLVGLRSVADSNRRKRFCRPLPSHSVNRPCYQDCKNSKKCDILK